jgi:uncharacterized protein
MSKVKEAPRAEVSTEEKLRNLYRLQKIDSKIDDFRRLKGELPAEVNDLEDEITGLHTRIEKIEEEQSQFEDAITGRKNAMKESESLIKKYQKQQNNVKNNREYDALSKEIEMQRLEIQLNEKRIREATDDMKGKTDQVDAAKKVIKEKEKALKLKKEELERIIAETEAEEKTLARKGKEQESKIDERLLTAYHRIRNSYSNGFAVVTVQRNSCGGCFNAIPPQTQAEIRQHKKIIVCEHCGRILVDESLDK